jgi:hypothetical protein
MENSKHKERKHAKIGWKRKTEENPNFLKSEKPKDLQDLLGRPG